MSDHYDLIIIGTGAGGGTLLHRLAPSGKRILVLERGDYLPREKENWDAVSVFQKDRYHTKDVWIDKDGEDLHPQQAYYVGGQTKVYGAALFRLRERDFTEVRHEGGISPAWPLTYAEMEPYYQRAEELFEVHGVAGEDPTEGPHSGPYPFPPVSNEPRIQEVFDGLTRIGHKPFHLPMGVRLLENDRVASPCIKCNTCDGYPCMIHAKSDADILCVRPSLAHPGVTLLRNALVRRLIATGTQVSSVEAIVEGEHRSFSADVVVLAAGAINSAVILLRSGLANGSDQVGRNFMKHNNVAMSAISKVPNPTIFQKTFGCNDYYWGDEDVAYPLGHLQLLGKANADQFSAESPVPGVPPAIFQAMGTHSVDWWLTGEDLPTAENRVFLDADDRVHLDYTDGNRVSFARLQHRWVEELRKVDATFGFTSYAAYLRKEIPLAGVAHQVGTCVFGEDPASSVLDLDCKAHELDNLYVVDGSFFPSIGAINPSLTIVANALRVGDHLAARLG